MISKQTKKLRGHITISRLSSNDPEVRAAPVRITIEDRTSGFQVAEVEMSLKNFAEALLHVAHIDCDINLTVDERIGLERETKTARVPLPENGIPYKKGEREAVVEEMVKPFEVDGWRARREDAVNVRRHRDGCAAVTFVRYVGDHDE